MDSTNTTTMNDLIGVEPFPKSEAPTQVTKSGFTRDTRKGTLVGLKVLFGSPLEYPVGHTVWVKSDHVIQPWAKEIFEINGQSVIFMPKSFVILRETQLQPLPFAYTPYPVIPVTPTLTPVWEIGPDGVWRKKP